MTQIAHLVVSSYLIEDQVYVNVKQRCLDIEVVEVVMPEGLDACMLQAIPTSFYWANLTPSSTRLRVTGKRIHLTLAKAEPSLWPHPFTEKLCWVRTLEEEDMPM